MRLFVREKQFYASFFSLLIVISLQNLISLAVSLADNIMLGSFSEYAMAGAAVANQVQFLLQMVIAGIASGIVVLGAQYWGKGETEPIRRIISVGMKFALLTGVVFFVISYFIPEKVLLLLTNDRNVINEGVRYMRLLSFTNIIFSVSNTLVMSLRSVETAFIGTVMASCTLVIKLILNYCLIFGNFGFPRMGIQGAAISTLVGWSVELVIILVYIRFFDKKIKATFKSIFNVDFTFTKDYFKVATPVILSCSFWGVAQAAQTAILGHISETAIAANSIASVVFQVAAVLSMCAASAASVIIGKTVGEKRLDKVKPYTVTLQTMFVVLGLLSSAILFIGKDWIITVYAVSQETRRMAVDFMIVLAVTGIGTAYEYPVAGGIITGGGDTRYGFIVDMLFMWCVAIPLSALSAFVLNLPPVWTFFLLKSDQLLKCIPNAIRCNRYKWIRQLTH